MGTAEGFIAFIRDRVVPEEALIDQAHVSFDRDVQSGQRKAQHRREKQTESNIKPLKHSDGTPKRYFAV